ncbi:hypothetical protein CWS72_08055 [Telmatospirillum siberiense]|uniref:DUF1275 domain-containing protein n=2 Tax=Telmatospirillum siberiense TaxID=382514 RepID=A0A2N3PXK8_9PROT|nr:hypothetical protein CWS72_08055 [Telmatospirillum siberiense]
MMKKSTTLTFLLSFLSGYVDTAVYVYMGGLFVAHVTGNFVLLGTTMSGQTGGGGHNGMVALQLLSFPIFVGAAALATAIGERTGGGRRGTRFLFGLDSAIFALVGAVALAGCEIRIAGSLLLVVAMGFLNTAHRLDPTLGPPFTVMTGNVTGMAVSLARLVGLAPKADAKGGPKSTVAATAIPVAGFLFGCAGGALAQAYCGLGAMVVPALILVAGLFAAA